VSWNDIGPVSTGREKLRTGGLSRRIAQITVSTDQIAPESREKHSKSAKASLPPNGVPLGLERAGENARSVNSPSNRPATSSKHQSFLYTPIAPWRDPWDGASCVLRSAPAQSAAWPRRVLSLLPARPPERAGPPDWIHMPGVQPLLVVLVEHLIQ
jgi:hypothetical protein